MQTGCCLTLCSLRAHLGNKSRAGSWGRRTLALCARSEHLGIDELDDVGVAAQALQQLDLVDEAGGRLVVAPRQPDALQRIYLPVRRHHLPACSEHDDLSIVMRPWPPA